MLGRQKRHVPTPTPVGPHQSTNPMFPHTDWARFRRQVYQWTGVTLFIVLAGWLVYGPWFAIRQIDVVGTRLITPSSITRVTRQYLDRQRWLILPNRTLWVMSAPGLTHYLQQQIQQRISVERVVVEKHSPHSIRITISERTPLASWTDGHIFGTIDREGKIIELQNAAVDRLPIVRDENAQTFTVDSSVVKQEVMTAVMQVAGYLQQAHLDVSEYLIPVPVCPTTVTAPSVSSTNISTTNGNQNRNTNTSVTNSSRTNTNSLSNLNSAVPAVTVPCDTAALRYGSQEIHVQLKDGPRVLFDRHEDLSQAVRALQRVLSERNGSTYRTVDVRFGERVYVQ